jgi:hypothetical protein
MQYTKTTQALLATAALALAATTPMASAEDAYIQSNTQTDGAVYSINTGYRIKPTTGIYADFEFVARTADVFPSNPHQQFVFEATGGGTARIYINGPTGTGQLAWNFTTEQVWSTTSQTMVPGTRYQMSVDASTRTAWLDVAGVRKYTGGFGSATVPNYTDTIKLFSNNSANGNAAMMKLYRFTITESGETVHDYIPALKGGMVGLYDSTTGDFLYDVRATPKAFTYGGDILELEDDPYIESNGTSWMNSRFFMNPGAKVEMDYALVGANALQARLFGADYTGATFFSAYYVNGSGNMSFGIGDTFLAWSTGIATNLFRHRAVLDVANGKAYYVTRFATNWTGNASGLGASLTKTAAHPLNLFGDTKDAASWVSDYNLAKVKVYGVRFWQDGELVHDYVPHVKGGMAGFMDMVDGAFITGENVSAFTAGGKVTRSEDDGFISSSGNNNVNGFRYINTGYIVTPHTRVEFDYAFADNYPSGNYNGNHDWFMFEASGSTRFAVYHNKDGIGWCGCGTNWLKYNNNSIVPAKQTVAKDVRRTLIVDNHTGFAGIITSGFTNYYDNVTAATESMTYSTSLKLASPSTGASGYSPLKIYGLKIYESGTLMRNYVPYVKDGVAGLRDTVSGGFIMASGKVAFTAGGDIASNGRSDAYLESDATQGINTGYLMKGSQSRIEADFAFTDCTTNSTGTTGYQQRVFGQDSGGGLLYALYINGSGNFMYGFGNTFINNHGPGTAADTKRHTAVIDGYHNHLYWITDGVTNKTYDISGDAHGNDSTWPMGIFATPNNQAATAWRNPAKMKLYSLRIYESDTLVHEYLPYSDNGVPCLYDTVDKVVKKDARNGNAFVLGGMGVEGAEKWLKALPATTTVSKEASPVTLTAATSGAIRYEWTKNGDVLDGETGESITAMWRKGDYATPDIYTCTAIYDVYGAEKRGAPVSCAVTRLADVFTIIVR